MPADQSGVRNALATRPEGGEGKTVAELLQKQAPAIRRALPNTINWDRFTRVVLTECKKTPQLLQCTPESLLGAVMYAAQLGTEPGPLGHAYLVPYRNRRQGTMEVQFILGYKGMLDLARRSGEIKTIVAREVFEADEFEVEYGLDERLIHKPALQGDRGATVAYYGVAKFKDGGHQILVLTREQVDERRERSKAKDAGPWKTDYDAMARKTVIRAMAPYLPLSVESAQAVEQDETIRAFDPTADAKEAIVVRDVETRELDEGSADPAPAGPSPDPEDASPPAPTGDSPPPAEPEDGSGADEVAESEPSANDEGDGPATDEPPAPVSGNPIELAQIFINELYDTSGPAATAKKRGLEVIMRRLGVEPEKELTVEQATAVVEWFEGGTG